MTHDPLCYMTEGKWDGGCQCTLIAKVRDDERSRWHTPWMNEDWQRGYRQGIEDGKKSG